MLKEPLHFLALLQRLKDHNMRVENDEFALKVLSEFNYYRFTGYALQFRDKTNEDDYIEGISFNSVWNICQFDTELRSILKRYLDIVELNMRTQISYWFSLNNCVPPPHNQHYDLNRFYNKDSYAEIILSLNREKRHSKDSLFVKHHMDKYHGEMPLWVIVELLSFSNLSKLYSAMNFNDQQTVAREIGTGVHTLKNHLKCLSNLRNKVAHMARLYNSDYNPPVLLGKTFLQGVSHISDSCLFSYIIVLLRRLPDKNYRLKLSSDIKLLIPQYSEHIELQLIGFPKNYDVLLDREIAF